MINPIVISHIQTGHLLQFRKNSEARLWISPDLGLTTVEAFITAEGLNFQDDVFLSWEFIEAINRSPNNCFIIKNGEPHKIIIYSEITNRSYSLMPTGAAPTMLVSGSPMHRIKGTHPGRDTFEKINTVKPITGNVLDTATGLGYTAIEAAKNAAHVVTIEIDEAALEIARLNPWSRALFNNNKMTQRIGDSFDLVKEISDKTFTRIIHDPPELSLGGNLYSSEFYRELYRLLQSRGRLFHYIGNPTSELCRKIIRGVVRRLKEVGFSRVLNKPSAFGVVAFK